MNQTFIQLGELLRSSVPTIVLLLLLYAMYHYVVHVPLQRVLAERRNRTQGAVERARADIAAAEAKSIEYENRLREAKLSIFRQQEAKRHQAQQARSEAIATARVRAGEQVKQAKTQIELQVQEARTGLQGEVERLSNEIIRTILQPAGTGTAPATSARS
jgi:F-type H+-transporting ATPase subunit b